MSRGKQSQREPRFVSLRWRFTLPLFVMLLVVAMVGAYTLANNSSGGAEIPQMNLLLQSSRSISERASALYESLRQEGQRTAFTIGIPEAIAARDAAALQTIIEGLARLANLDSLIVTDAAGVEVAGLLLVDSREITDYAISTETDLSGQPVIRSILDESYVGATGLMRTAEGTMLYVGVPVTSQDHLIGTVLVGQRLGRVLDALHGSAIVEAALYAQDGGLAQTTFDISGDVLPSLTLAPEVFNQAAAAAGQQVPVQGVTINGTGYQAAYFPFRFGPNTLGVVAAFSPDNVPFLTEVGRQLTGLVMASVAGALVIAAYVGISLITGRVERVTRTAESLATGDLTARTGMKAVDEVGAVGQALDQYADYVQERQDALRLTLRRQRREAEHLTAVLESLTDGVVVQDLDGRVILMNDIAKRLLGSQRVFRSANLHELTAAATDRLGPVLSPGLYTLGDPRHIDVDGKMLSAQAAAVLNIANQRVGTVLVLRDVTGEIRLEKARESMLDRLTEDVQKPLAELARSHGSQPLNTFARELSRHAITLQKLIVEMREMSNMPPEGVREGQRPLLADTLVWAVANEWRQVATASNLELDVIIEKKGLYILGDERRLRWAIGNILDNAIKYTPPGGKLTLEIRGESDGAAYLRIRDNGVGIAPDELPHIFTRFYRGNPVTEAGRAILVPGMGQGLTIAKQILEGHGGKIEIKSKPGTGTAVNFTLPLTAAISLELPHLALDMEGETIELKQRRQ